MLVSLVLDLGTVGLPGGTLNTHCFDRVTVVFEGGTSDCSMRWS